MKDLTITLLWIVIALLPAPATGQGLLSLAGSPPAAAGYTGDLLTETYNTAAGAGPGGLGYDTAHTETSTPDENYTTVTPASGSGEALFLDSVTAATTKTAAHTVFANRDDVYGACLVYIETWPAGDREIFRFMLDGAQSSGTEIRIDGDGDLRFLHNTITIQPADKIPQDAWVAIYWYYLRDTDGGGASGTGWIEWANAAGGYAKTGAGTKFATSSVGAATAQLDAVNTTAQYSGAVGPVVIFDDYFLSTTAIPSNPWGL